MNTDNRQFLAVSEDGTEKPIDAKVLHLDFGCNDLVMIWLMSEVPADSFLMSTEERSFVVYPGCSNSVTVQINVRHGTSMVRRLLRRVCLRMKRVPVIEAIREDKTRQTVAAAALMIDLDPGHNRRVHIAFKSYIPGPVLALTTKGQGDWSNRLVLHPGASNAMRVSVAQSMRSSAADRS